MAPLIRRLLLGAVLFAAIAPLATPVFADDDRRRPGHNAREQDRRQHIREVERRRIFERQRLREAERRRYDNYYRRPDVYYSAPPVVYPPPVYYQRPGPELNFTFPFIYR